ncbi:ferrous iron transport protein B [Limnoglobus roseus]|uniref:Ferrous iron transport protein B n=1 Tax=Limnoglobus roseus TaxID=2598579 RepID=A0A5C1ABB5_9BACT|nr:ferrous iron transport protein B [Limnoglobus roseus]QEL15517.1 ferrous iron transport protein B [Limnoglobus roseus]
MTAKPFIVALVGNPNAGKSTLFNALSGLRQHVGNYPGVTVELKKGSTTIGGRPVELIDLPGTYSLAARSPDEMVAVDLLLGRCPEEPRPDVILAIVDASNLERHLYLTTQLMELGTPVVLAVNMVDVAKKQGIAVDVEKLSQSAGLPVVAIQANTGAGLDKLKAALAEAAGQKSPTLAVLPPVIHTEADALHQTYNGDLPPFLARRLLLDVGGYAEKWLTEKHGPSLKATLDSARQRLIDAGHPIPAAEAKARYGWIRQVAATAVTKPSVRAVTATDKLDKVLTHKVWGTLIFLAVMFFVFQAIFVAADVPMGWIDDATGWVAGGVESAMSAGPLRSLLADGVVKGVGGVIKFLPQILFLFGFIAVLEDCGYMARAAFLMDKVMSRCGLNGKSFIPLLSSVACAIPGIMATRVIENRRDRFATILVAPLMSCSARLPVYSLLIAAFLTKDRPFWLPGLMLFAMYLIGFVVAPLVALLLKRTLLRGDTPVFVMELPQYKRPSLRLIVRRMIEAGWAFVRRAGTIILASMVLIWALLYFPHTDAAGQKYEDRIAEVSEQAEKAAVEEEKEKLEQQANEIRGEWKRNSLLGQAGLAMEPAFRPLGWDWQIGVAVLASFPAREVIVGTLSILYDEGDADDEKQERLQNKIASRWADDPVRSKYGVPVALSVMVFFALCCQCASTLAVIRRETRSWWWPAFTFVYMTALAYVAALVVFQVGRVIVDALG